MRKLAWCKADVEGGGEHVAEESGTDGADGGDQVVSDVEEYGEVPRHEDLQVERNYEAEVEDRGHGEFGYPMWSGMSAAGDASASLLASNG